MVEQHIISDSFQMDSDASLYLGDCIDFLKRYQTNLSNW